MYFSLWGSVPHWTARPLTPTILCLGGALVFEWINCWPIVKFVGVVHGLMVSYGAARWAAHVAERVLLPPASPF